MTYELWDIPSRNLVGAFETEAAALAAIRAALAANGRAFAEGYAVIREDRRGRSSLVAEGSALIERALATVGSRERLTA